MLAKYAPSTHQYHGCREGMRFESNQNRFVYDFSYTSPANERFLGSWNELSSTLSRRRSCEKARHWHQFTFPTATALNEFLHATLRPGLYYKSWPYPPPHTAPKSGRSRSYASLMSIDHHWRDPPSHYRRYSISYLLTTKCLESTLTINYTCCAGDLFTTSLCEVAILQTKIIFLTMKQWV